jgi:signal transduction histidine kinase
MRGSWLTFTPLLAAAALALWGGERLARREMETRTPADRERLHDFSAALREELDWLDDAYRGHLRRIAAEAPYVPAERTSSACTGVVGVRECHLFRRGNKAAVSKSSQAALARGRLPEVEAKGGKRPLNPDLAVVLPEDLFTVERSGESGIIVAPDGTHQVRWMRPDADHLVAFTIDTPALRNATRSHLEMWLAAPFAPLRESGELVSLTGPGNVPLVTLPAATDPGPAALVMPHRTSLGEWQVQAWDRRHVTTIHDSATLILASGIAAALLLLGAFLSIQQRRALRLAEERVSFVNRVSHELGSPLTNILLNLDLSLRALDERPAESRRRLSLVNEEVQRLARLVSNVLTFSRGERKTLDLRPAACIPDEVVEGVLAQFQPSLERRKVSVEWQRGASSGTRLDPDALAQITGNLISNVEKYASTGGWLGLETRMENGRFQLRIRDRGPGIPPRQKERIFEAFERVHRGVSEGSSGTGLGLSIARDLARRMGGDLLLKSSENGAVFQLDLPAPSHLALVADEPAA